MSPKSQVELPLDRIDEALVQCAIPGFWGELSIEVKILPAAAFEVELHIERRTVTQTNTVKSDVAIVPSNERVNKVRQGFSAYAQKFRLECPVSQLRAQFRDGHLVGIEVSEVQVARAGV
jgi:hypothetical protein